MKNERSVRVRSMTFVPFWLSPYPRYNAVCGLTLYGHQHSHVLLLALSACIAGISCFARGATARNQAMRGCGIGMMKRPPRSIYSAFWRITSASKFQASSSTYSGWSSSNCFGEWINSRLPTV